MSPRAFAPTLLCACSFPWEDCSTAPAQRCLPWPPYRTRHPPLWSQHSLALNTRCICSCVYWMYPISTYNIRPTGPGLGWLCVLLYPHGECVAHSCHCCLVVKSCLTLLWPHWQSPTRLLCPWQFPGKNSGVGCHFLLWGTFLTQGSNPSLLHCREILCHWATWEACTAPCRHLINNLINILKEMGISDHLTCLLNNLYAGQEATVRTGHGTTDWFQIGKGVHQGCILSLCLFNLYAEYLMWNARLEEAPAGIKIARRNNNLRYADDTTLMAKSKEE